MNDAHPPRRSAGVVVLDTVVNWRNALHRRWTRPSGSRRLVAGVIAGVVATLLGTALLVVAFLSAGDRPPALGARSAPDQAASGPNDDQQPVTAATQVPPRPSSHPPFVSAPTPAAASTAPDSPAATPQPAELAATFARRGQSGTLASYGASITITNPGEVTIHGWTVTLSLSRASLTVSDVNGATARQDGTRWIFSPSADTAEVAPHASVVVSLRVNGLAVLLAEPVDCTIDARPCTAERAGSGDPAD
jgi:hypothetical protein